MDFAPTSNGALPHQLRVLFIGTVASKDRRRNYTELRVHTAPRRKGDGERKRKEKMSWSHLLFRRTRTVGYYLVLFALRCSYNISHSRTHCVDMTRRFVECELVNGICPHLFFFWKSPTYARRNCEDHKSNNNDQSLHGSLKMKSRRPFAQTCVQSTLIAHFETRKHLVSDCCMCTATSVEPDVPIPPKTKENQQNLLCTWLGFAIFLIAGRASRILC